MSELPSAWKDANSVLADMQRFDLAKAIERVVPYGSIMAGNWSQDAPWRRWKKQKE